MEKCPFIMFTKCNVCKHSVRGNFWTHGHIVNKYGRGLLADATYQISRL